MPEPPDFDEITQNLIHDAAMVVGALSAGTDCQPARRSIVEQLRQIWNARGATAAGPYVKNLDRALRSLDR